MVNGFGLGELHWGGLAQQACVQSDWLTPIPAGLTSKQAMAIGTAGYTAMLCVLTLEQHNVTPEQGEILVTGAAGGVGSVAIALLAKLGFSVVASTGRVDEADYLHRLGAVEVIDRAQLGAKGKPLGKERWAGVIDTVGSHTLANACATTKSDGVVAACGLAQGFDFPATVMPFILRGITLVGINSVYRSKANRMLAWQRLVSDLDLTLLATMTTEICLHQAIEVAHTHMQSNLLGRYVVNVNA
jgi:acrylyl-CoA reductase (NADPH)